MRQPVLRLCALLVGFVLPLLGQQLAAEEPGYRVYRQTAPDGSASFSDESGPGAVEIRLQEPTIIQTPKPVARVEPHVVEEEAGVEEGSEPTVYEALYVVSPQQDEGVRANNGDVQVVVSVQPALGPDDHLEYVLDGQLVLTGATTRIVLPNLDRGAHSISVGVAQPDGQVAIRSETTRFFVLRHSILAP